VWELLAHCGGGLARWQRYPAAVAAGDAIKFKLDAYGGRQLRLDALAQLRRP
jgi:hypothetical protein